MSDTTSQSYPSAMSSSHTDSTIIRENDQPVSSVQRRHAQNAFLEFVDEKTEARFIQYRFGPPGLYFPCILSYVFGFTLLLSTSMDATADTMRDSPTKWFFQNYTWYSSERMFGFYAFCITSAFLSISPTILLLYNTFAQHRLPMSGRHLEMFYVFMAFVYQSHHSYFDLRYSVFCVDNSVSLLLRDIDRKPEHGKCEDFVEPYILVTMLAAFVLPPRLRYLAIFVFPWAPSPFLLRTTIFDFKSLFRTSDAVWVFTYLVYIIGFIANERILRRQFIQHEDVKHETEEAERAQDAVHRLLDAMLPVSVLKRLIVNEPVADCGEVSVAFSDVAGFTAWCSAQKAEDVVRMLNTMYNYFDSGLVQYGIEKIKTIGDAYWAVCGLPDPNPNHVLHACAFAKYIQQYVKKMSKDDPRYSLRIRVGVHTGQVCGGLVGKQQRTYDMFGTSNEVAELMEQKAPVNGILLSEPAYRQLKKSFSALGVNDVPNSDGVFSVELFDPSIDTAQGNMASFILKTFTWLPPTKLTESSVRQLNPTLSYTAIAQVAEQISSQPVAHVDDLSFVPTRVVIDENVSVACTGHSDDDNTVVTEELEMHELTEKQEKNFKASHKVHHTFDDEEVEAEFQQFMRTLFPHKLKTISSMHAIMVLIIYIVMLAEGRGQPWYVHILMIVNFMVVAAQVFVSTRVSIHPLAGLVAYYVECNMLLFTLLAANRSVVANDLVYMLYNFVVLFPTLGFVGGGIPYLYVCVASIAFLTLPTMVLMVLMNSIYVAHIHIPAHCAVVWVIALRRSEIGQRQQFKDKTLAEKALHRSQTQHKRVSELIARMVPSFMVEELTVWACGPRNTMIADNFPMVGILFTRFPALRNQFSDSSVDPLTVMRLIGDYVSICDGVVEQHVACTKLKIIGDVQLFASGLVSQQVDGNHTSNPLVTKNEDACSVESSNSSTMQSNDGRLYQHLPSLAHLAVALSVEIATRFEGAQLSAGMHCGPATAGVIGNDRLIYDVFGDTVNIASRVMSTSGEGVWGSTRFCSKVSAIPHHGLFIGNRVERTMKGKGTVHVKPVAALPR